MMVNSDGDPLYNNYRETLPLVKLNPHSPPFPAIIFAREKNLNIFPEREGRVLHSNVKTRTDADFFSNCIFSST